MIHRNEPARVLITDSPHNAEAPLDVLGETPTPLRHFFVRNHFQVPYIDPETWVLHFGGDVTAPFALALPELRAMRSRTVTTTLECAGNGRGGFVPPPEGEPWGHGAVATGLWRGVPLASLLERAGLSAKALEIVFEGADRGQPAGGSEATSYARALPVAVAFNPDTLLAYELNGARLPPEHGSPVRLIVPDWYGMASVKWLTSVAAVARPFAGHFQRSAYLLHRPGQAEPEPVRRMQVKSLITSPSTGASLGLGRHRISGVAWSGHGVINKVEVCTDTDDNWSPARLTPAPGSHAWHVWDYEWEATRPERYVLRARAFDEHGNAQPEVAAWNHFGYANNAIQRVVVQVHG